MYYAGHRHVVGKWVLSDILDAGKAVSCTVMESACFRRDLFVGIDVGISADSQVGSGRWQTAWHDIYDGGKEFFMGVVDGGDRTLCFGDWDFCVLALPAFWRRRGSVSQFFHTGACYFSKICLE